MDEPSKIIADLKNKLGQSEAKYNLLMEQATDGIYLIDLDDNFIEVSAGLCSMLGYEAGELLKMDVHHIIDPEQLKVDPLYKSGIEHKRTIVRERRFIRKDRTTFEVEINVKMLNEKLVLVIARDITGRKKMERELREAELKFRTIAEHSMVGIYIVQDGKFNYVNPRYAEILGYEPHELINTFHVVNVFHESYQETAREHIRARLAGEIKNVKYEARFRQKNGTVKWLEVYGSRTDFEGVPSLIGSVIDITERKKAEEVLIHSEANLQTILNNTNTAYVLYDRRMYILSLNQAMLSFARNFYGKEIKKGDSVLDFFLPDQYPRFASQTQEVLNGSDISYEINYPQPNAATIWFNLRMTPIRNDGEILGMMVALYDISEIKNTGYKLQAAYEQIQTQINHIKDIAWKQSHLMRSPLVNLKGLVEMLKNDPEDIITLNYIETEIGRLDDIIIDMSANKEH